MAVLVGSGMETEAFAPRVPGPDDLDWMHALNETHATELSPMSRAAFADLVGASWLSLVIDPQAAMLIAFDHAADYDSVTFLWHRERLDRFAYVDRVAVSDAHRRKGLAGVLYDALAARARGSGISALAAEVNSVPPNPASDRFHIDRGFQVVGEAVLEDRGKTVRYYRRDL